MSEVYLNNGIECRPLPGFPGYFVRRDGVILSIKVRGGTRVPYEQAREMRTTIDRYGYRALSLFQEGKGYKRRVHSLVLRAFVGPPPEGMECRHMDGNHLNNHVTNLRWGTQHENYEDMRKHGRSIQPGAAHPCARLSTDDVYAIRQLAVEGVSFMEIGRRFGITGRHAGDVAHRKAWRHLPG